MRQSAHNAIMERADFGTGLLDAGQIGTGSAPPGNLAGAPSQRALSEVDWNFPMRTKSDPLEALHPYPAKFIREIPAALLDNLEIPEGTCVLDPFCGSGTTLVEAQRAGHPSVGIDLNPIACLLSRVKTGPMPKGFVAAVEQVCSSATAMGSPEKPPIPNIDHWFAEDIQDAINRILLGIDDAPEPTQEALKLALSSIVVKVSRQDSDTRYAAVENGFVSEDVRRLFRSAAFSIHKALRSRAGTLPEASVIESDILDVQPNLIENPVGLIVTSPPYPNAYEYWLYHKYRMYWLGMDPIAVKASEIGARSHYFKKNHHTPEMFVENMRAAFRLFRGVMVPGGKVCLVIGRSRIHGEDIDNASNVISVAESSGFETLFSRAREISPSRKSFNLSYGRIKKETLLVFEKTR